MIENEFNKKNKFLENGDQIGLNWLRKLFYY